MLTQIMKEYRVRIDDVIFNSIVRVGMAEKDNIFYDINLEVDSTVPRTNNSVSQISKSTSIDTTISHDNSDVNTYNTQNPYPQLKTATWKRHKLW